MQEPLLSKIPVSEITLFKKEKNYLPNRFGWFLIRKYGVKNEIYQPEKLPIPVEDDYLAKCVKTYTAEDNESFEDIWDTENSYRLTDARLIFMAKRC